MQKNIHQQVTDAVNVLGVTLKVSNPLRIGPSFVMKCSYASVSTFKTINSAPSINSPF